MDDEIRSPTPTAVRLAVALGVCLAVATTLALGTRAFHTNDDPMMASLASGDFTGRPDGRLVFIGPLVGFPIAGMYRAFGGVPWYGLTLYGVHVVALVSVADVVLRRRDLGLVRRCVIAAAVVSVAPRFLLALSFTTTAFVALLASGVLLVDVCTDGSWRSHWFRSSVALTLLALGTTIRVDTAKAFLLLLAPIVVAMLARNWRTVVPYVGGVGAVVAVNRVMVRTLTSEEYRNYLAFNRLRGALHDTPRASSTILTPEVLSSMGWTSLDRALFALFWFDDAERFTPESLRIALSASRGTRVPFDSARWLDVVVTPYPWLVAAVLVVLATALLERRIWAALLAATIPIVGIGAMTWIFLTSRVPERVSLPMWLIATVFAALSGLVASRGAEPEVSRGRNLVVPAGVTASFGSLLVLAIVSAGWRSPVGPANTSAGNENRRVLLAVQQEMLATTMPDGVVLAPGGGVNVEGIDPLAAHGAYASQRLIPFGWTVFSPMLETRKANFGITDSMTAVRDRDDVAWLANEHLMSYYQAFLETEADPSVGTRRLTSIGCAPPGPICLWQLTPP